LDQEEIASNMRAALQRLREKGVRFLTVGRIPMAPAINLPALLVSVVTGYDRG
jgi:hypothetical protein